MSCLKIGIVKEQKDGERRVACTPNGVMKLIGSGHDVYIEKGAGLGSGFLDMQYEEAGGILLVDGQGVFENSQIIFKVKEIEENEFPYIEDHHIILSFLHSNSNLAETAVLLKSKCVSIALEDITDEKGGYPLLEPMSDLAGRIAFIESLNLLKSTKEGHGLLLNGLNHERKPEVVIFGAGHAARGAAKLAAAFGNQVTLLGRGEKNLMLSKEQLPKDVMCRPATRRTILECCGSADVIINCVLWPKSRTGHLLSEKDLQYLRPSCLIVDVACDENGAIESCRPTSISKQLIK